MSDYLDGKISCELCKTWIYKKNAEIWIDESFINPIDKSVILCVDCMGDYTHAEIKERFRDER